MSRRKGIPRDLIKRYARHYSCTLAEAKIRAERGDPLPERGTGLRTGRAAVTAVANSTKFASLVLGGLGAVFGTMSLLIRLFEKKEE